MSTHDVVVIGGGVMGSATAHHLARAGRRVLLLEQFELAHARGSSHGESRVFRFAYPRLEYARLAMRAQTLWRALEAETGTRLLIQTGGLDLANDDLGFAAVREVEQALEQLGARREIFDRSALAERFPQFDLGPDAIGLHSPDAGVLLADRCVSTMIEAARRRGAVISDREPVLEIRADAGIEVVTAKGTHHARKLVVTAGAWARRLLGASLRLDLPLTIEKEQVAYFRGHEPAQYVPGRFPIWIHHGRTETYGLPDLGRGMKAAFHHAGRFIEDPDLDDRVPDRSDLERLERYVAAHLPGLEPVARDPLACLYTDTPTHDFLLGVLPETPDVILGSPCSGHGFKFAIAIGKALADLATDGVTDVPIDHCRIGA